MLKKGSRGHAVRQLQEALRDTGFNPGAIDGIFGRATETALRAYQRSEGLVADGIAGPATWSALDLPQATRPAPEDVLPRISVPMVAALFPDAGRGTIARHLPDILDALRAEALCAAPMVLMALATVRAETAGFEPISEKPSRFNTSPGGSPFDLYDHRKDLGNRGPTDGADFCGRGFVQLTGRSNYARMSRTLGMGSLLLAEPERANDAVPAARVLAAFLRERKHSILAALLNRDLRAARRLVNGGTHGLTRFSACYRLGEKLLSEPAEGPYYQAGSMSDAS